MVIRWVPSVVRFVAYYANLLLISSFLGLGIGAMIAGRKWKLFPFFPLLLALDTAALLLCRHGVMPASGSELRFYTSSPAVISYLMLISIFVLNTAMFVPLGQRIGQLFQELRPLRAYAWDLGGSLCGTICFGLFSLYHFSPAIGIAVVLLLFMALARDRARLWNLPIAAIILMIVPMSMDPAAIWSPYYYVTIHDAGGQPVSDPPVDLRTMKDPPIYSVSVNQDFYQQHGTIDLRRYTPGGSAADYVQRMLYDAYLLPHRLRPGARDVCVVGAGGGIDVEAALLSGAQHVDAVEIDRVLVNLSRRFNASGVYDDPRVSIHINDARAFFRSAKGGYDLVAFGFLDSQALFSYSSNVRLDGFIYTVESIRTAYSLLSDDGMLSISFVAPKQWLADKLVRMVWQATGKPPVVYNAGFQYIICAARAPLAQMPPKVGRFVDIAAAPSAVELPTDDWPYLYLSERTIPPDYLIVIASLLVLSIATVYALRSSRLGAGDAHFFFLGLGFLLLETKSIGDCSLYFGTTWLVTLIVVAGVLLMVLAANLVAMRVVGPSPWLYVPLLASLFFLYAMPRDLVLGWPWVPRLIWALLVMPLPIFFAGLVFSTGFRDAKNAASLLGANLVGATIGGFCEYLGMAVGTQALMLLVIAAYAASLACRLMPSRVPRPATVRA